MPARSILAECANCAYLLWQMATKDMPMSSALKQALPSIQDFPVHTDKIDPVSYTHLRAHETVLELVCSLLLEQKKGTHPHIAFSLML